jgi:hypothetical protein
MNDPMPPPVPGNAPPAPPPAPNVYVPLPVKPTSNTAIVSLVAGLLSWILLPVIASVIAIIAGHMARSEIRRSNGALDGDGLALAGMVLGYVQIGLALLAIIAIFLFFGGIAAIIALSQ